MSSGVEMVGVSYLERAAPGVCGCGRPRGRGAHPQGGHGLHPDRLGRARGQPPVRQMSCAGYHTTPTRYRSRAATCKLTYTAILSVHQHLAYPCRDGFNLAQQAQPTLPPAVPFSPPAPPCPSPTGTRLQYAKPIAGPDNLLPPPTCSVGAAACCTASRTTSGSSSVARCGCSRHTACRKRCRGPRCAEGTGTDACATEQQAGKGRAASGGVPLSTSTTLSTFVPQQRALSTTVALSGSTGNHRLFVCPREYKSEMNVSQCALGTRPGGQHRHCAVFYFCGTADLDRLQSHKRKRTLLGPPARPITRTWDTAVVVLASSCAKLSRTAATSCERHCCSASAATPPAPEPPLPWLPAVLPPPLLRRPTPSPRELLPERCSAAAEEWVPVPAADRGLLPPWEGGCWESDAAVGGSSAASTLQCQGHEALFPACLHRNCAVQHVVNGAESTTRTPGDPWALPSAAYRAIRQAELHLPISRFLPKPQVQRILQDRSSVCCHQRAPVCTTRALPSGSNRCAFSRIVRNVHPPALVQGEHQRQQSSSQVRGADQPAVLPRPLHRLCAPFSRPLAPRAAVV